MDTSLKAFKIMKKVIQNPDMDANGKSEVLLSIINKQIDLITKQTKETEEDLESLSSDGC